MVRKKQQTQIITGIDIGSSAIRIATGQYSFESGGDRDLQLVGTIEVTSEGVHKGVINSIEECVSSLSNALEQMERLTGVPVEHAWIGISGTHIISQQSKGVVAVAKSDGEISEEDVERAVEAARMIATPLNYEILHVIPRTFSVDGQTGIKDPVGMTGIRLEADTRIIYGLAAHIKNITKAVYRTGIDIDDLVLSVLATGEVVATPRQKDLGVAVVDIGSSVTSVVIYEEGDIIHTAILPIGSEHITNDIAIGLRTSIDAAEHIKLQHGQCLAKDVNKKSRIDLADVGAGESEMVEKKYIAEIIGARVAEILEKVNNELVAVQRSGLLPAGVIFTGGGAKIGGLVELAKEELRLPASLGYPIDITGVADRVGDISFSTAIGLVKWGASMQEGKGRQGISFFSAGGGKVVKKVQSLFKSLMP